jgi:hypothetical protein
LPAFVIFFLSASIQFIVLVKNTIGYFNVVPKTEKKRIVENVPSFILIAKRIQTITGYAIIKRGIKLTESKQTCQCI